MQFTQYTKKKYEIELNEKGEISSCFREDRNCFMQNGQEVARSDHRAPIDLKEVLDAINAAYKVDPSAPVSVSVVGSAIL